MFDLKVAVFDLLTREFRQFVDLLTKKKSNLLHKKDFSQYFGFSEIMT